MVLTCAVNGEPEAPTHPIFICHHCGKPVCADHGWAVLTDYAFDDSAEDSSRRFCQRIMHVREWRRKRVPQRAVHCDECRREHHQGEYAETGWASPKVAKRAARVQPARAGQPAGAAVPRPAPMRPGQPYPPQGQPYQSGQQGQRPVGGP